MKRCAWCDQLIRGEAKLIPDCSASGTSPPVYWHAKASECGQRRSLQPTPDPSPSHAPVTAAMWDWRESRP